ncbi:hypothetical protein K501DRAFT_273525 [Backusella circina FSU 941]|nr:hypothetical protein K501DRAFT_273525 [Backusella circina FSU 941]
MCIHNLSVFFGNYLSSSLLRVNSLFGENEIQLEVADTSMTKVVIKCLNVCKHFKTEPLFVFISEKVSSNVMSLLTTSLDTPPRLESCSTSGAEMCITVNNELNQFSQDEAAEIDPLVLRFFFFCNNEQVM